MGGAGCGKRGQLSSQFQGEGGISLVMFKSGLGSGMGPERGEATLNVGISLVLLLKAISGLCIEISGLCTEPSGLCKESRALVKNLHLFTNSRALVKNPTLIFKKFKISLIFLSRRHFNPVF